MNFMESRATFAHILPNVFRDNLYLLPYFPNLCALYTIVMNYSYLL